MSSTSETPHSGSQLPPARTAAGKYATAVVTGDRAYTSGVVGWREGEVVHPGCLGVELDVAEGRDAARQACLQALANLDAVLGGFDRVEQVIKLTGYVRASSTFESLPQVLDGASEVLLEFFGERGRSARTTVGVAALPKQASVELDLVLRVAQTDERP